MVQNADKKYRLRGYRGGQWFDGAETYHARKDALRDARAVYLQYEIVAVYDHTGREIWRWSRHDGPPPQHNPVAETVPRADAQRAAKLLMDFSGHAPTKARNVAAPKIPKVVIDIGSIVAITYDTTRDGKRERYQHTFREKSRPHLATSSDGKILIMLGGAYQFTDRGIVDR